MTPIARAVSALVLLAALGGTGYALLREPEPVSESNGGMAATTAGLEPRRFVSSAECRDCHEEVWNEWHGSQHQISYLNPEVRKLSEDFRNKECQSCHLPQNVFRTGLLERTLPRFT